MPPTPCARFGNYIAFVLVVLVSAWALQSVALFIGATIVDFQEGQAHSGPRTVTRTYTDTCTRARTHTRTRCMHGYAWVALTTGSTFMLTTMLLGGFYVRLPLLQRPRMPS
jgi:hypothetical protein